jgi:hypothetical protein
MADTVSQKLMLEVEANISKATADLAKLKNEVEGVGGGGQKAAKGFDKISASADRSTKAIRDITVAVKAGKIPEDKAQARISKRIKLLEHLRAQQGLSLKQRTKLDSAIMSSKGASGGYTKELKAQTGIMSKMNNMSTKSVFAISNMAQTFSLASGPAHQHKYVMGQIMDQFALMGPKGLLVGSVTAGLGYVWGQFNKGTNETKRLKKELEEFTKQMKKDVASLETSLSTLPEIVRRVAVQMKVGLGDALDSLAANFKRNTLTKTLSGIRQQLLEIGKTDAQKTIIRASAAFHEMGVEVRQAEKDLIDFGPSINSTVAQIERLEKGEFAQSRVIKERVALLKVDLDQKKQDLAVAVIKVKTGQANLAIERDALGNIRQAAKELEKLQKIEDKRTAKKGGGGELPFDDFVGPIADDDMGFQDFVAPTQKREEAKTAIVIKEVKKRTEAEIAAEKQSEALKTSAFNLGASLISESIKMSIEGEKNLGQALLKMFLERTGQTLVALGTRAVFEGGIMLAQGNPQGALQVGLGSAAIAAGVGMSAGAAQVASGVGAAGGAGGAGVSSGSSSGTTGGISSGGFGGSTSQQGTGSTIINISYGVGGPEPESAAQAVLDAIALGGRRGMRGRA